MKVQVENVDRVRRKIEVILDEENVRELENSIYEDLRKKARIKGFRPGKVPRSVLSTYYKDVLDDELKRKIAEDTIAAALSEANVDPVSEPSITFYDEKDTYGYTMECEVAPDFELPQYKGLEVEVEPLKISSEDVDNRLDALKQMHAEVATKESGDADKGDFVVIKYEGFVDGKPLKDAKSDAYPLDLGSSTLAPEFESAIIGMKVGEEKEVEIAFAADYPDKEVASKKATFKVLLKEVKQKRLPEINDEFAKDLGFENMDRLRQSVSAELQKEKENERRNKISDKILDQLLAKADIPVPGRLLEKRLTAMVQEAKSRMKANRLGAEEERNIDILLRKELEPQAEKGIRAGMLFGRIAKEETIQVEDSDVEERIKKIAEDTKRGYDYIKDLYEKHNLLDNLRSSLMEEKTMDLLIGSAQLKETV
ncbi:MAG TPA: trigger factor [Syntrophorhabdales bacterium]|nr:trigger factor [Syntrophorhabdales bacterium]